MNKKAIVIEDDPGWQKIFQRNLKRLSGEREEIVIKTAPNYDKAIALLEYETFHLAIVDIRLDERNDKNIDGLRILQELHKKSEITSSLVITGHGSEQIARDAFKEYGVFDYLEKENIEPAQFDQLARSAFENSTEKYNARYKADLQLLHGLMGEQSLVWDDNALHVLRRFAPKTKGVAELTTLVKSLFANLFPLLPYQQEVAASINSSIGTIYRRFWSKATGCAILAHLGSKDYILSSQKEFLNKKNSTIEEFLCDSLLESFSASTHNLAGSIYTLSNSIPSEYGLTSM